MVRDIIKSPFIFKKADEAAKADLQVAIDLADTLKANRDICVGMAANMIGVNKRIIAFCVGPMVMVMINPKIVAKSSDTYEADEGCLSLCGTRKAVRSSNIEVEYSDIGFTKKTAKYSGFVAQIIQHEIDHCDGVMI